MSERCPKCGNEETASTGTVKRFCSVCNDDFATDSRMNDEAFSALAALYDINEGDSDICNHLKTIEEALNRWHLRQNQ